VADAFNVGQRPKADEYDESTFVVLRSAHPGEDGDRIDWFQIALFVLDGVVITVGEHTSECLEPVRQRVRTGGSALRGGGADRLAAVVIDTVVDGYFPALEVLGDRLEVLEEQILEQPGRDVLRRLYRTKRDLVAFRRATWPLRDALHDICRTPGPHFGETVHHELRDTTDHVVQVVDLLESYRELASSLVDVHVSMLGQRTNESVRVLTVVSTIFIPLTFLAGVFGMNFDRSQPGNMPELGLPYGYVAFWLLCLALALALVLAFRRLGWLGRREREPDVE
jgi:magnesium transporter